MTTKSVKETLFETAKKYLTHSHSPYSKVQVASAIELMNGEIFGGCNIENASFGGTVCGERVAIWKALSERPGQKIKSVMVVTDQARPWSPCGLCRQVIAEFATPETEVYVANLSGIQLEKKFTELFPDGFGPSDLKI